MPISSETTPLLGPEDNESSSNATGLIGRSGPAKVTPVPWLQVSVLCVARMLDGWVSGNGTRQSILYHQCDR